jgi:hypothetical protein
VDASVLGPSLASEVPSGALPSSPGSGTPSPGAWCADLSSLTVSEPTCQPDNSVGIVTYAGRRAERGQQFSVSNLALGSFAPVCRTVTAAHDDPPLQQRSAHSISAEAELTPTSRNNQPAAYSRSATSTCLGLIPRGLRTVAPRACNRCLSPVRLTPYRSANSAAVAPVS